MAEEPIHMGEKGRAGWIFKEGTPLVFLISTSNGQEGNAEYREASNHGSSNRVLCRGHSWPVRALALAWWGGITSFF